MSTERVVALGFDHAGYPLKETVLAAVEAAGWSAIDLGTDSTDPVDYPEYALAVGRTVHAGDAERGIVVCGSGAGVGVAACKLDGIRCAMAHDNYTAHQCVEHDNVNVLALGARVVGEAIATDLVTAFLGAEFSGAERHVRRLAKLDAMERDGYDAAL